MVLKLLAASALLIVAFVSYGSAPIPQTGPKPIVVSPSPTAIYEGDPFAITVQMDQVASTNTTVYLSSNSPLVSVPASVTLPAGYDYVNVIQGDTAAAKKKRKGLKISRPASVAITATANGTSKTGYIVVN